LRAAADAFVENHAPMNRLFRRACCALLAAAALAAQAAATPPADEEARLLAATQVLDALRAAPDQRIPESLLQRAYGVAVVPSVTKVALFLGGRRGSGVLTVRDSRGRFSSPVFINLTGASFGLQWGAQETDVVLVFITRRGIEGIAGGKLTFGAGASVAAGPVGRQAEAATGVDTEAYAYSRSRGLFAGVALDGTSITISDKSNGAFYGRRDVLASDIISGAAAPPDSENARRFLAALAASTGETAATAGTTGTATSLAPAPVGGQQAAPASSQVQTFPMEDPSPGKAPPR